MRQMIRFWNVLVHSYAEVDPRIVRDVAEHQLGDPTDFVAAVRARLMPPTAYRG
jgi:uncharacterized protein YutE (UPF0331/DUF86 family)